MTQTSATNREQIENATIKLKKRLNTEKEDLIAVMSTPEGRRFVRRLIVDIAGCFRSSYLTATKGSDPVFFEGNRNVGLVVYSELEQNCFDQWQIAQSEHNELKRKENV